MLAELDANIWVAFYTIREDRVRIISVRRARPQEKEAGLLNIQFSFEVARERKFRVFAF